MGVLDGRAVVVTGAGRGIGRGYALACAEQGAAVVVNDIDESAEAVAQEIVDTGGRAIGVPADISDYEAAGRLVQSCLDEFQSLDGLVNNAGLFAVGSPTEASERDFRRLVDVNVLGSAFCGLHALRHMLDAGRGSLVNVTSGSQAGTKGLGAYAMTKGAVSSLTYSWALDVAGTGVRVNAVSPNAHTEMSETFERYRGTEAEGQNIGKDPASNAPAVLYLLSDLSAELNGQVVRIDAGNLTFVTHPQALAPFFTADAWTASSIAEVVRGEGARYVQPVGAVPRQLD
jgi:NAD(P)-dependent dehydrogenase (short-subunit alcohol dehydrogenase family)